MEDSIPDYSLVTETPGLKASGEQVERLYQRYRFAEKFAAGKEVLEVACGGGLGLGYLAKIAKNVRAGDIDPKNVSRAKEQYRGKPNIEISRLDAHRIPFAPDSFDLVLLYEAIYYLQNPEQFVAEAQRTLRKGGTLIICTVNKDWEDFLRSSYATKYFSLPDLHHLLKTKFARVNIYGGFPVNKTGIKNRLFSLIKHSAMRMHLIPGSLKCKAYLKRIFMGKLVILPEEVFEGMTSYQEPVLIDGEAINKNYKIIYAVATKTEWIPAKNMRE